MFYCGDTSVCSMGSAEQVDDHSENVYVDQKIKMHVSNKYNK